MLAVPMTPALVSAISPSTSAMFTAPMIIRGRNASLEALEEMRHPQRLAVVERAAPHHQAADEHGRQQRMRRPPPTNGTMLTSADTMT
jgi:hypothetical protein